MFKAIPRFDLPANFVSISKKNATNASKHKIPPKEFRFYSGLAIPFL
jgi:hypothetical protein